MKPINELINQVQNRESETQSTGPQLTTGDKDLVNWFFMRLQTNYGSKFWTQFSDEKTVLLTKREWANQIISHTREELHTAIELSKEQRQNGNADFEWPDIAKILGLLKNRISPSGHNSTAYIDWDSPKHPRNDPKSRGYIKPEQKALGYRDKRKAAGRAALASMMEKFPGPVTTDDEDD